ncbi:MAG: zinc metallopeptidase [Acetatifactor sp.]|nr:zinc metallopeptidase [Acetatifactor sp.]
MYYYASYGLVIIGLIICLCASANVKHSMKKYAKIPNSTGLTGAEVARRILNNEGLYNVQIECLMEAEGDHYDPQCNTVRLSFDNFNKATVTAAGVAAHECGHAIQHAKGYAPLNFRTSLVPVVNIGSQLGFPIILLGVILSYNQTLIQIGIWAFSLTLIFQLATLPVEFNASTRAIEKLSQYGLVSTEENNGCRKVLFAAALTYVAAAAASALQVLRLILIYGGGGRRRK